MEDREKPFLHTPEHTPRWDWWSENPVEIVLVVFLVVLFFFFTSLPPQGCGIEGDPQLPASPAAPER